VFSFSTGETNSYAVSIPDALKYPARYMGC